MKIPPSITIRGVRYKVRCVSSVKKSWTQFGYTWDNRESVHGFVSFDQAVIVLDKHLCRDALEQCFWHEVAHVIVFNLGRTFSEGEIDSLGAMLREFSKGHWT